MVGAHDPIGPGDVLVFVVRIRNRIDVAPTWIIRHRDILEQCNRRRCKETRADEVVRERLSVRWVDQLPRHSVGLASGRLEHAERTRKCALGGYERYALWGSRPFPGSLIAAE